MSRRVACLMLACLAATAVWAEVPPRSDSGQTLAVPERDLELGEIYHVSPAGGTQFTWTTETPLVRTAASCNRVVGYVVAPFDIAEGDSPILAGALRIPVASLVSGIPAQDRALHGAEGLHVEEYPELRIEITGTRDAKLESDAGGRRTWSLHIEARLHAKDEAADVSFPATALLVPFTWQTMNFNLGDFFVLRGRFDVPAKALGLPEPTERTRDTTAETVSIGLNLVCSTASPDKNLDPSVDRAHHRKQLWFLTLLRDFDDPERAYAYAEKLATELWKQADALNRLARAALTEPDVSRRDFAFIRRIVERANELTAQADAQVLDTLGRLHFELGEYDAAVRWQTQAVEHIPEDMPPYAAQPIRAALESYRQAAGMEATPAEPSEKP